MSAIPHVSIIVPHYNHGQFLEKRLKSIFNQTYQNFEVILLDDASTDHGTEILKKYAGSPRVSHLVINRKNSGSPFKQWKKGIDLASGKFIWIAESDDWADISFLEQALAVMTKHRGVGLLSQESYIVDGEDQIVDETNYSFNTLPISEDSESRRYNGYQFIIDNMLVGTGIYNASGVLFQKDLAAGFTKYINFYQSGDSLFWCHLLTRTDIIVLKNKYNYFRRHHDSATYRNHRRSILPILEMYATIELMLGRLGLNPEQQDEIYQRAFDRVRRHIRSMRIPKSPQNLFSDYGDPL